MDKSLKSLIDPANSVLILLPTKPYFDQVAAGLGLFLALKDEKEVNISCPSEMLVELNRLIGINQVSKDLGNKNLVISFSDYQSTRCCSTQKRTSLSKLFRSFSRCSYLNWRGKRKSFSSFGTERFGGCKNSSYRHKGIVVRG